MIAIARKLRPRRFITFIVVAWGLVTVGHGLVRTWRQMLALRMLLGILEAGYVSPEKICIGLTGGLLKAYSQPDQGLTFPSFFLPCTLAPFVSVQMAKCLKCTRDQYAMDRRTCAVSLEMNV